MMLRRLLCFFRGHVRGRCVYQNDDLRVYECSVCYAQYPIFTLGYHVHEVLEEANYEGAERLVGKWLS